MSLEIPHKSKYLRWVKLGVCVHLHVYVHVCACSIGWCRRTMPRCFASMLFLLVCSVLSSPSLIRFSRDKIPNLQPATAQTFPPFFYRMFHWGFRTAMLSIHLGNVRSLANKMDELMLLNRASSDFSNLQQKVSAERMWPAEWTFVSSPTRDQEQGLASTWDHEQGLALTLPPTLDHKQDQEQSWCHHWRRNRTGNSCQETRNGHRRHSQLSGNRIRMRS